MRDFLQDKNILGCILVSHCGKILHHTIPEMMLWVNNLLIFMDNENEESTEIVNEYIVKYPGRIRLAFSSNKDKVIDEEKKGELYKRFNKLQGEIREEALNVIKEYIKSGEKIDIVMFYDSDEFPSSNTKVILQYLVDNKEKKGIIISPIFPFEDMRTLINIHQSCHLRIFKPSFNLTFLPYRGLGAIWGITKPMKQMYRNSYIHLSHFTEDKRRWRMKNWRSFLSDKERYFNMPLWTIDKDAKDMTHEEVIETFNRQPDLTVGEYLKKHNLEI
jgi:hypothetical protein